MEVILRKYGNSMVAVLPPAVLRDLGLSAGQTMTSYGFARWLAAGPRRDIAGLLLKEKRPLNSAGVSL